MDSCPFMKVEGMDPRFREDDGKSLSFLRRQESIGVFISPTNQPPPLQLKQ